MKFFTDSIARCTARIGTLSGFERLPNISFETPLLLIYTKVWNKKFFCLIIMYFFLQHKTYKNLSVLIYNIIFRVAVYHI